MAKKETFVQGALILIVTSVFVRLVGMVFRVYLSRRVGAQGMGLYQLIFSVYSLLCTVSTAGVSVAVTRLVAQKNGEGEEGGVAGVMQVSLAVALFVGFAAMGVMYFGAQSIAMLWLKDLRALQPLKILSFGLPAMAATAVYRGYFVAIHRVAVQSASQVCEQLIRMGVIFLGLARVANGDITGACVAVVIGNVVSEIAAAVYVVISYYKQSPIPESRGRKGRQGVLSAYMEIMLPVALASYAKSFLHTLENTLVPGRLAIYLASSATALAQFGVLKGMVMPVVMFPSSFLVAVAMMLVPEISQDLAAGKEKHMRKTIGWALHLTVFVAVLIALLFVVLAQPIAMLLYQNMDAALYIQVLGPVLPFMYLEAITEGLLRGINKQASSLLYTLLDSAMRITLILLLVPRLGMQGFLYVMLVSNVFTSVMNLRKLLISSDVKVRWVRWVVLPVVAALISAVPAAHIAAQLDIAGFGYILQVAAGGSVAGVCYLILCALLGCFSKKEYADVINMVKRRA